MNNHRTAIMLIISAALMAATPLAYASTKVSLDNTNCSIESDYGVGRYGAAYLFKRTDASPKRIAIGGGKLYFDGQEAKLNAADKQRVANMESQMRALGPQAQEIARDAIDIAFIALQETAKGLAPNDKELASSLEQARVRTHKQTANLTLLLDEKADENKKTELVESITEPVILEYVPKITSAVVSSALGMVFGGEAKAKEFEQRMQDMEKNIEQKVEARAEALEPKAKLFCEGMRKLDDTENQLEFRTPDGKKLELFSVQAN